jgi:hypothetical protein
LRGRRRRNGHHVARRLSAPALNGVSVCARNRPGAA